MSHNKTQCLVPAGTLAIPTHLRHFPAQRDRRFAFVPFRSGLIRSPLFYPRIVLNSQKNFQIVAYIIMCSMSRKLLSRYAYEVLALDFRLPSHMHPGA